jgi:hypothetical protein
MNLEFLNSTKYNSTQTTKLAGLNLWNSVTLPGCLQMIHLPYMEERYLATIIEICFSSYSTVLESFAWIQLLVCRSSDHSEIATTRSHRSVIDILSKLYKTCSLWAWSLAQFDRRGNGNDGGQGQGDDECGYARLCEQAIQKKAKGCRMNKGDCLLGYLKDWIEGTDGKDGDGISVRLEVQEKWVYPGTDG